MGDLLVTPFDCVQDPSIVSGSNLCYYYNNYCVYSLESRFWYLCYMYFFFCRVIVLYVALIVISLYRFTNICTVTVRNNLETFREYFVMYCYRFLHYGVTRKYVSNFEFFKLKNTYSRLRQPTRSSVSS